MNKNNEGMPFIPEEDLDLHEDFAPIIAESGVIRPKVDPREATKLSVPETTFTRLDTVQDLMQIRSEQEVKEEKPQKTKAQSTPKDKPQKQAKAVPPAARPAKRSTPQQTPANPVQHVGGKTQTIPVDELNLQPVEELVPPREQKLPDRQGSSKSKVEKPMEKSPQSAEKKSEERLERLPEKRPAEQLLQPKNQANSLPQLSKEKPIDKSVKSAQKESAYNAKQTTSLPPKTPAQPPVAEQPAARPKKRHRFVWMLAILCFLFLGTIGGIVPVEKIPFLRDLAYAMGFTKDDTSRMSFLRALLTWTDKTLGIVPGDWENPESRSALWARLYGESAQEDENGLSSFARMQRESGKTNLIDINALNALQRQKGWKLDGIRASVAPIPGQETAPDPAKVRDDKVNVRTEANQDKGEVYFGSDANSVARNFQDGYDSVNTLKKIANPHIANGEPIDWLKNMTQRMMKTDLSLGGINKELHGTQVNWGMDLRDIGEEKPHRDLYHAWIASRMSKYTTNLMLKKALADTAFMGADMPDTASNVLMFGGIQVDAVSLQEDQEAWKKYMEWEKNCREDMERSGRNIDEARDDFNSLFWENVRPGVTPPPNLNFPTTCGDITPTNKVSFQKNLATIAAACKTMKVGYESLKKNCSMQVDTDARCTKNVTQDWSAHWDSFATYCKDYCEKKRQEWEALPHQEGDTWNEAACQAEMQLVEEKTWLTEKGKETTQGELSTAQLILEDVGGSSDYFPQITKNQEYEDETGNVHQSIVNAMGHNQTLN